MSNAPASATSDATHKKLSAVQWLAIALGVAIAVMLCITAGRWQFGRYEVRDAAIHTIKANYQSQPRALADLVPSTDAAVTDDVVWKRAQVTGHYAPTYTALLRNRPINSTPSVHVLVPFVTQEGTTLLINRGWVPFDTDVNRPSTLPNPPAGTVDVVVHLRKTEPQTDRQAPVGQVQAINVDAAIKTGLAYGEGDATDLPNVYTQVYGSLDTESVASADAIQPLPRPSTDPKNHLSYAFQWWVFAIGAAAGFVVLIIKEVGSKGRQSRAAADNPFAQLKAMEDGIVAPAEGHAPAATRNVVSKRELKRKAQGPSEEEYEDSLFE